MKTPEPDIEPFIINRFEGGLNNSVSPLELNSNESPKLLNVLCDNIGVVETRPGLFKYILTQLPEIVYKAFKYETDTFTYILLSSKTKLYRCNPTTEIIEEVCTISNVINGFQKKDKFYFVDGSKYREYNGTNVYEIMQPIIEQGMAQSGTTTTVVLPNTANVTDDYYNNWEIYIASGTGYGQKKIITDYVGSTKTANVAWDTAPDATSLLYFTQKAMGSITYDEGAKTIVYTPTSLEFADDFKGVNSIDTIKTAKRIIYHKQRFWFYDGDSANLLMATDIDNQYYVPNNMYIPPITDDGDGIVDIISFTDSLVISKHNSAFALYGTVYNDFELKQLNITSGVYTSDTMKQLGNYMYFLGTDGIVYKMYDVRTDVKKLVAYPTKVVLKLSEAPINIDLKTATTIFAVAYKKYYMLVLDDKILVYNIEMENWVIWDNWNPTMMFMFEDILIMSNSDKLLYRYTFDRFYMTETFAATAGQTDFIMQKGYLNIAKEDVTVTIDGVAQTTEKYFKASNTTVKLVTPCVGGEAVVVKYYSLQSYNDVGVPYNCEWYTKDLTYGLSSKQKKFRKIFIVAKTFTFFVTLITYKVLIDYMDTSTDITIRNQKAIWGLSKFGDRFLYRNVAQSEPIQINQRGRIIRYGLETVCNDNPFYVHEINGEVEVMRK
jgi:hypothetical protein